jgi:hypothetical protein
MNLAENKMENKKNSAINFIASSGENFLSGTGFTDYNTGKEYEAIRISGDFTDEEFNFFYTILKKKISPEIIPIRAKNFLLFVYDNEKIDFPSGDKNHFLELTTYNENEKLYKKATKHGSAESKNFVKFKKCFGNLGSLMAEIDELSQNIDAKKRLDESYYIEKIQQLKNYISDFNVSNLKLKYKEDIAGFEKEVKFFENEVLNQIKKIRAELNDYTSVSGDLSSLNKKLDNYLTEHEKIVKNFKGFIQDKYDTIQLLINAGFKVLPNGLTEENQLTFVNSPAYLINGEIVDDLTFTLQVNKKVAEDLKVKVKVYKELVSEDLALKTGFEKDLILTKTLLNEKINDFKNYASSVKENQQ